MVLFRAVLYVEGEIMNLAEGLIQEMNRCREVLREYQQIPEGAFGAMMIKRDIEVAEHALGSGDVVAMLSAYKALQGVN